MDAPPTPAIMEKIQWRKSREYPVQETTNDPLEQCISNQAELSQVVTSQHDIIEISKAIDPPKELLGENQDQGIDLNKTPQQKPRRKKHRPKVIIEGKTAKTTKTAYSQATEKMKGKRKNVRDDKGALPKRTIGGENVVEPTPGKRKYVRKSPKGTVGGQSIPEQTLGKRKYVRKNKEDSPQGTIGGQNVVEPISGMRKYVRKKKEDNPQHSPESTIRGCNVSKLDNFSRNKSVKRSLNFDFDNAQANESNTQSTKHSTADKNIDSSDTPLAMNSSTNDIANMSIITRETPSRPYELSGLDLMKMSRWKEDFAKLVFNLKPMTKDENSKRLDEEIDCMNVQSQADPKAKGNCHNHHVDNDKDHANISTTPCSHNILKKRRTENDQHEITANTYYTASCTQNRQRNINSVHDSSKMSSFPDKQRFMAAEPKKCSNCVIVVNHVTMDSSHIQVLSRNWASYPVNSFKLHNSDCSQPSTSKKLAENESFEPKACDGALVANQTKTNTSKRRKKEQDHLVRSMAENAKKMELIMESLARRFTCLNINAMLETSIVEPQKALVPFMGAGMMISYVGPFEMVKRKKPRAKVDLDDESQRVWNLLMGKESDGGEETNVDKEKWWEEERRVFHGRTDSFIARMHLIQGDRGFSQWKGSVVDSVVGVFLTQNVSDHLSSSAFMSLAAKFPFKSESINTSIFSETNSYNQDSQLVYESNQPDNSETPNSNESSFSERGSGHESPDSVLGSTITSCVIAIEGEENKIPSMEDVVSSQNSTTLSVNKHTSFTELLHMANNRALHAINITGNKSTVTDSQVMLDENKKSSLPPSSPESNKTMGYLKDSNVVTTEIMVQQLSASGSDQYCQNQTCSTINITSESLNLEGGNRDMLKTKKMQNDVDTQGQSCSSPQKESDLRNSAESLMNNESSKEVKPEAGKTSEYDWDSLRRQVYENGFSKERSCNDMDSLDYEALRNAHVDEISHAIRERGMNNKLAERIKNFLDRLVRDHGSVDLEWLRHISPDKAKDYLLSIRGLGLKSVECVRLLTLHQVAFPVDTNVARVSVRLGWVPLQPLPESLQLHLLEMYPMMETIQKYLWPRLCKLDQQKLYELHYQLITFGKVFCTKSKPNCNSCPMRGECKHFASAYASARLALPGPDEKRIVTTEQINAPFPNALPLPQLMEPAHMQENNTGTLRNHEPIIEEPSTPEPECIETTITDIEDAFYNDPDEIPTIKLNFEEFTQNLQNYMHENNMQLKEGILSNALVAVSPDAATIPVPKLKNVNRLRTEHQVYELPDGHALLEKMDKREPDDPSPYLLAIWTAGETAQSTESPKSCCDSQDSDKLCNMITCFSCNSIREAQSQTVRGTILIPCRTANRGSFPLNGTYFQVNEVFADHDSSHSPIDVPREWIWNLNRRTVYFGTSIPSIFKGLTTEEIQHCFWRGFVCVRGFDRATRAPKPLFARLHFPVSKVTRTKKSTTTAAKKTTMTSTPATTPKAATTVTTSAETEKTKATISTVIPEQDISVHDSFQSKSSDNISPQININDIPIN